MAETLVDTLPWIVVASLGVGFLLEGVSRRLSQAFAVPAWFLLGGWFLLIARSLLSGGASGEGVLVGLAALGCLLVGASSLVRRQSMLVLGRFVALTGAIYLPFFASPALAGGAIELTARMAADLAAVFGYDLLISPGARGYENQLAVVEPDGTRRWITVIVACTGVGSIAVVAGLVAAVRAPLGKRMAIATLLVPALYALNVVRVAFIALAYGHQWFHVYPEAVLDAFGASAPRRVSYFVADRIIAQLFALVLLILVMLWLLRVLPALADLIDEVAYLLTGRDPGLRRRLTPDPE